MLTITLRCHLVPYLVTPLPVCSVQPLLGRRLGVQVNSGARRLTVNWFHYKTVLVAQNEP